MPMQVRSDQSERPDSHVDTEDRAHIMDEPECSSFMHQKLVKDSTNFPTSAT